MRWHRITYILGIFCPKKVKELFISEALGDKLTSSIDGLYLTNVSWKVKTIVSDDIARKDNSYKSSRHEHERKDSLRILFRFHTPKSITFGHKIYIALFNCSSNNNPRALASINFRISTQNLIHTKLSAIDKNHLSILSKIINI